MSVRWSRSWAWVCGFRCLPATALSAHRRRSRTSIIWAVEDRCWRASYVVLSEGCHNANEVENLMQRLPHVYCTLSAC